MANKNIKIDSKTWITRIDRARKFRDQVRDKQGWLRFLDEYKGEYKVAGQPIKALPINLVYGYVQTAISKIYFRDPHMTVSPRKGSTAMGARIIELLLNYIFKELNLKNENGKVLLDTYLISHGWLKYGYSGEIEKAPGEAPDENSEFIKNEEIWASYVPWDDVLFDVTLSKDPPYDCNWIAHRIIKPLDEIKGNPRYENTEKLSSNVSVRDSKGEKIDETLKDSDLDLFEFWEIWDKKTNKIYCVAEGTEGYLREVGNTYQMEGLPFSMLKFNLIPGEPYPLSDIAIIEPQVLERIRLRSAQVNHIKRWSRQLSIEKGSMSKQEMEKFSQGIDGAVTEREKGSQPPVPIQYADMQKESFLLDDLIQRDMDAVIGQNDVERGGQARTKTDTLGELKEQQEGTAGRAAKRQDQLEDFLEEAARKIIALIKQFQNTPRYVKITGMSPEEIAEGFQGLQTDANGIYFTKDDIQGEYDIEVKAGSTLPLNRQNKVKVIEALISAGPSIGIVPGSPVSVELGKALVRELDLKDVEKAYEQQIAALTNPIPAPGVPPAGLPAQPAIPQEPLALQIPQAQVPITNGLT